MLVGDMDNSGSLNAQVIHQLGPGLRSKMAIQVSGRPVSCSPSHPEHPAALYTVPPPTDPAVKVRELAGGRGVPGF